DIKLKLAFPVLDGFIIGDNLDENKYFHGLNGGSMGGFPIDFKAMYGYSLPVMDVYNEKSNTGIYLRINDTSNTHKVLDLVKRTTENENLKRFHDVAGSSKGHTDVLKNVGMGMAVQYLEQTLSPNESLSTSPTVIAIHQGDWRECMKAYRGWVMTWYKKQAPRPLWFRKVFVHKALHQQHYHPEDKYIRDWIQRGDDMVDINHWMVSRGDYHVRDDWGGAELLKEEICYWRDQGIHTSLYLESVCVGRQTELGKAHGQDWSVLQDGQRATSEADLEWNFCAGSIGWQDYLAKTCARLVKETDCDSLYPDSVGLRYYLCEDPKHDHPVGSGWYGSVERLLQKLRKAVKPETILYLEYISTDVNTQYLDGCYSPCVNAGMEMRKNGFPLYVTGTNLFRFYFPDFKFIEIMPETEEGIGLSFFNGNGIHGYLNNPDVRPYIEKLSFIYREYSDAFTSELLTAYYPTLKKGVFSNAFTGDGRVVYTIYNSNDEQIEGNMIQVPYAKGTNIAELIRDREAKAFVSGNIATLSFRIEPREVLCIVVDYKGAVP
ncbi:MAG: hypothetical protein QG588_1815, partial [Candidatus Poribacteria bacterium]|nr:hypothetical protein [Candidatus Poribacteria bacterium]